MTAYRFATLTCDDCGQIWDGGTDRTFAQARAGARSEGWHQPTRGTDQCGICRGTHILLGEHTLVKADVFAVVSPTPTTEDAS